MTLSSAERSARHYLKHRVKCLQKARAKYAKNQEKEKQRHRRWVDDNAEHLRAYGRQRYADDPEPKKEQSKAWRDRNPGKNATACMRRKQRARTNPE